MKLSHVRGHPKKLVNILKLPFHEELSDFIRAVAFKACLIAYVNNKGADQTDCTIASLLLAARK